MKCVVFLVKTSLSILKNFYQSRNQICGLFLAGIVVLQEVTKLILSSYVAFSEFS